MWCIVNLPNGTQQAVKWDPKAIGQECLEKVCKALGIISEMEYFGLEHWMPNQKESRTRQWINLRNRLTHDGSSGSSSIQLMLALRVKFWVPVHFILQESVRNLFYMQAKVDLIEGRLNARDWSSAAKLSALLCQADGIRFNEMTLKSKCPVRLKKEQQDMLKHQQQHKEKKDKEYVLSFKKRRLSKQKSIENIANCNQHHAVANQAHIANDPAASSSNSSSSSSSSSSSVSSSSSSSSTAAPARGINITSLASSVTSTSSTNPTRTTAPSNGGRTTKFTANTKHQDAINLGNSLSASPLRIYEDYIIRSTDPTCEMPDEFLRQIAIEHGKLATLKMTPKSAKYWLLQEIQELPGYGEEVFCGVTTNENSIRCDIAVGAHGITVCTGDEKNNIPFSAIAAAKSFRRTFKLEYVDDHNDRKDLEIKLPKHAIAAGLYRSITERHAFYVCDKVRGVVTNQFTRDLKGTIASMFKEDTELGKRYVFDIQRTCREVHDQARRTLHERGIEITAQAASSTVDDITRYLPMTSIKGGSNIGASAGYGSSSSHAGAASQNNCNIGLVGSTIVTTVGGGGGGVVGKVDLAIREKEEREAAIERCVDTRISEAMTCKICMDRAINTMFNPCCHVMACSQCAGRCTNCPNCRVKITSVVKIYLPPELRTNQFGSTGGNIGTDTNQTDGDNCSDNDQQQNSVPISTPKITAAA